MSSQPTMHATPPANEVWTSSKQAASSQLKILKLLELGENEKGRFARVEFDDESVRPLYLLTIADAWHSIFNSLDYSARWMIRGHFNRRLPPLTQPEGALKSYRHATFSTEVRTPRGKFISSSCFDLSAYEGVSGEQAGLAVARELLELYATGNCEFLNLSVMFDDLVAARSGHAERGCRSFLLAIDQMLRFAARHGNFHAFLDEQSARYEESEKWMADLSAKQKAAFVERMKTARLTKRHAQDGDTVKTQLLPEATG